MDKTARLPRRAVVTAKTRLTETGTVSLTFRVEDGQPFVFEPGRFVSIDCEIVEHRADVTVAAIWKALAASYSMDP